MTISLEERVAREWRCFHCDEIFTTIEAAREHFGPHELADPACQIDINKFREMEHYYARCQAEDSDSERKFHAMQSDHYQALRSEEEKGFERGLKAQLEKISDTKTCPYCARAAIAAVRERDEAAGFETPAPSGFPDHIDRRGNGHWIGYRSPAPDPVDAVRDGGHGVGAIS